MASPKTTICELVSAAAGKGSIVRPTTLADTTKPLYIIVNVSNGDGIMDDSTGDAVITGVVMRPYALSEPVIKAMAVGGVPPPCAYWIISSVSACQKVAT